MNTNRTTARLAGFIYLVVIITGFFSLMYVPSKLIVWENAGLTFQNISSSIPLFSWSIASSILCYIAFTLLPLALYYLLKDIHKGYAGLMVVLALISVPISFINLQNKFSVLTLTKTADYLKIYSAEDLQAQVMLMLKNYNAGILMAQVFWGLWLLPFGYLVYKSGFLPRILGVFLMLGCLGYTLNVFGRILVPDFSGYAVSGYITLPATIGEIGICLWMLIFGVKNNKALK